MPYALREDQRACQRRSYHRKKTDPIWYAKHLKSAAKRASIDYWSGKQRKRRESSPASWLGHRLSTINTRSLDKEYNKQQWSVAPDVDVAFLVGLWNKQKGRCALTGVKLLSKSNSPFTASIDRITSNLGYTKRNIQLVSYSTNLAKNTFSPRVFAKWVKAVKSPTS